MDRRLIALPLAALGLILVGITIYEFASEYGTETFLCGQSSDYLKRLLLAVGLGITALASAGALLGWRPAVRFPILLIVVWALLAFAAFWLVPLVPECLIYD